MAKKTKVIMPKVKLEPSEIKVHVISDGTTIEIITLANQDSYDALVRLCDGFGYEVVRV